MDSRLIYSITVSGTLPSSKCRVRLLHISLMDGNVIERRSVALIMDRPNRLLHPLQLRKSMWELLRSEAPLGPFSTEAKGKELNTYDRS